MMCAQAYKYIQRPTPLLPPGGPADLDDARQPLQVASGATNSQKGQTKQTLFPPFPQVHQSYIDPMMSLQLGHCVEYSANMLPSYS